VAKSVTNAINSLQKVNPAHLEQAAAAGNVEAAVHAFDWQTFTQNFAPARDAIVGTAVHTATSGAGMPTNLKVKLNFTASDSGAVKFAQTRTGALIRDITEGQRDLVRGIITQSQRDGVSWKDTAKSIRQVVGLTNRQAVSLQSAADSFQKLALKSGLNPVDAQARADVQTNKYRDRMVADRSVAIARTEISFAQNAGRMMGWQAAITQGFISTESTKTWITAFPCPECAEYEGDTVPINEPFDNGEDQPPLHPNCFPAGTFVQSPELTGATLRWYEGELVELTSREGIVLSATPNHPILTPNGWVAAGMLDVGDEVIRYPDFKREALIYPNDHHVPTPIEEVADAFSRSSSVSSREMPVAAMDFHGDGVGSDSAIILSASFFFDCKSDEKSDSSLVRESPQEQKGFDGLKTSLRKNMISLSFAQSINALASEVSLDDLGHCRVDVVTAVVRSAFAGHVYNLETVEGWYIANGIVTHNCKCTMILNPVDPSANDQSGDVGFGDGTTEWDGWGDSSAPAGADTSFIDTGAGDGAAAGLMGGGSASAPVTAPTQPAAVPVRVVTPEPERPITPAKPTPTSTVPTTSPKKVVQPKPKTQAPAPPGKPVKAPKIPPVKVDKVPVLPTAQSVSNSVIGNFDIAGINSLGDEAAKLYTARKKGEIKDFGDQYLHAIQEKQGFNALPKLVGKEELKQLISNGWTKTFRGLTGESGVNAKETIAEFKNGVNYSGQGIYGGGSYTSNVFSTALLYAGNKESGVMSLAIAPDAKIISYNEIAKITIEFSYSLEDNPEASSEARWLSRDPGNMAALLGYDVIKYDHSNGEVYYVVLNRGKVAVVK
jgi:hypothetical protein